MLVRHELLPFCLLHVARSGRNSISGAASFAISPRPRDHSCERPIGAPQSVLPVPQTTLFPAHDKHSGSAGFPGRRARGLSKPGGQARVPGPALCARWRIRISGAVGPGPRSAASGVPRCQCVGARRESQQAQRGFGKKGKVGARVQRSSTIISAPRQWAHLGRISNEAGLRVVLIAQAVCHVPHSLPIRICRISSPPPLAGSPRCVAAPPLKDAASNTVHCAGRRVARSVCGARTLGPWADAARPPSARCTRRSRICDIA